MKYLLLILLLAVSTQAQNPWEPYDQDKKPKKSKKDDYPVVPELNNFGFFLVGASLTLLLLRRKRKI